MNVYTKTNYVLGCRCGKGHGGNRHIIWFRGQAYAECAGCGTFVTVEQLPRFATRREALRADHAFKARWPEDSADDVLAGRPI